MAEEKAASGGATILAEESAAVPAKRRKTITKVSESAEATREGDAFVSSLLSAEDLDDSKTLFCIISKGRWANVLKMENLLLGGSCDPSRVLWLVGEGERAEYALKAKGRVLEGGALCVSRNRAIEEARALDCTYVVQLSDDLKKVDLIRAGETLAAYHDAASWAKPADMAAQNLAATHKLAVSPVGAARLLRALMRATDTKLGGGYPNANGGLASGVQPVSTENFIVGDFLVIDVQSSALRFDERLSLKEDYDFTAAHLELYGKVARSNRVLAQFEHYTNEGGAVAIRTSEREQHSIALLRHKWPGAFREHATRGKDEVTFCWNQRDVSLGGKKSVARPPPPEGITAAPIKLRGGQKTLTSFFTKNS